MRLFISYAHDDYPLVAQIVDLLPGQDWKAESLLLPRSGIET